MCFGVSDSAENRLEKIARIVEECRYGVHDISAVCLDPGMKLPRFNMPFELGLYPGCRRYGGNRQRRKMCLVMDSDRYRYRASLSDVSGQDIRAHDGDPEKAVIEVRNWLSDSLNGKQLPLSRMS